jgi:hypothetical protein
MATVEPERKPKFEFTCCAWLSNVAKESVLVRNTEMSKSSVRRRDVSSHVPALDAIPWTRTTG